MEYEVADKERTNGNEDYNGVDEMETAQPAEIPKSACGTWTCQGLPHANVVRHRPSPSIGDWPMVGVDAYAMMNSIVSGRGRGTAPARGGIRAA